MELLLMVHLEVVERILSFAVENGFSVLHLDYSPIKGPEGNIEYLACLSAEEGPGVEPDIAAIVAASHGELDKG